MHESIFKTKKFHFTGLDGQEYFVNHPLFESILKNLNINYDPLLLHILNDVTDLEKVFPEEQLSFKDALNINNFKTINYTLDLNLNDIYNKNDLKIKKIITPIYENNTNNQKIKIIDSPLQTIASIKSLDSSMNQSADHFEAGKIINLDAESGVNTNT